MPIDLLGYKNQNQDFYGEAPLEDVAKDVYKRGVAAKHPDYVDHKNFESWSKVNNIESQIKAGTPLSLAEKLRDATAHLAPEGFEDIPTSFVKGATLGYVPAVKTPEDAGIVHKMATGAAGLAGMGVALWGPSKLLKPAASIMGRIGQGAALGGAWGAARKPEEGENRLENLAADAAMFGAFGGGGALVERVAGKLMPETVGKFLEKVKINNEAVKTNKPELFKPYTAEETTLQSRLGYVTSAALMGGAGAIEPAEDFQQRLQNVVIGMGVGAGAHGAMAAMHALTGGKITPEQKAELGRLKVREDALDFISAGLETGKVGDQDFTPDHAVANFRVGYEQGIFNDADIDILKEKQPQLSEKLNEFITENALAKVDEALLASTLYTPEQISGSAKVRFDYLEGRGTSATEQEVTERDFLKQNIKTPEAIARGYGLTLAKPEEIATSVDRVSEKKAGEAQPILIRKAERTDLGNATKSLAAIPEKPGYDKVYQADGAKGKGFYYEPNRHLQTITKIGQHEKLGNLAQGTEENFGRILNTYKESGANLGDVHYEPNEVELDPKKDEDIQKLLARGKTQEEIDSAKKDGVTFVIAGMHEHWKAIDPATMEGAKLAQRYKVPQEVIDDAIAKKQRIAFTAGGGQYKLSDKGDWSEWSDITLHKNSTPTDAWHEAIHGLDVQGKLDIYPGERGSEEKAYALEKTFMKGEGLIGVSAGGGGPGMPLYKVTEKEAGRASKADYDQELKYAKDVVAGKASLDKAPHYSDYRKTVATEAGLLGDVKKVLFVGSGPMPISPILLHESLKKPVDGLDVSREAADIGKKVAAARGMDMETFVSPAESFDKYGSYDGIVVSLEAGTTKADKISIFKQIAGSVKEGTKIIVRTSADKTGKFPNVSDYVGDHFTVIKEKSIFGGLSKSLLLEAKGGQDGIKASDTAGKGALHQGDGKAGVPGEHPREDAARAEKISGGRVTVPYANYKESLKVGSNRWIRDSDAPTNKGRTLMIQFTTDLMGASTDSMAKMYDLQYSGVRSGYARAADFWELPQWAAYIKHMAPDSDFLVVRNVQEAKALLKEAGYDHVVLSSMDVNKDLIKDLADGHSGKLEVGGYVKPENFDAIDNVRWHDNMPSLADALGVTYKEGTDYSHFKGTAIIPRLTMSRGCKYKCAFCAVTKELAISSKESIDQQVESFKDLDAKLIYLNDKTFSQADNYQYLSEVYDKVKKQNPEFEGFIVQTTATDFMRIPSEWLGKSGIKYVELGIESYNDFILKSLHKPHNEGIIDKAVQKLRESKMNLVPNVIIGIPEETNESYTRTLDFVKKNKDVISHGNIYNLSLMEGTEITKRLDAGSKTDLNQNTTDKSFHTDPEIHQKFADDIFNVMTDRLKDPAQFAIREQKERDEKYTKAVEAKDMDAAQELVGEAAKAAGYNVGPVYHGTPHGGFTKFKHGTGDDIFGGSKRRPGFSFHFDEKLANTYMREKDPINPQVKNPKPKIVSAYLKSERLWDYENPEHLALADKALRGTPGYEPWMSEQLLDGDWEAVESRPVQNAIKRAGFDSFMSNDHPGKGIQVIDPAQIKSADPITYDAKGKAISISERFNDKSSDIRYKIGKKFTDEERLAGVPKEFKNKQVPLTHFSGKDGLKNIDPKFQGTGSAGAEKLRMTDDYIPRTYWGAPGYKKEAWVSGNNQYTATVDGNAIYDFKNDPLGLIPTDQDLKKLKKYPTDQQARMNLYEKNIRDAGFKGYNVPDYKAVALFETQDVQKVPEKMTKYAIREATKTPEFKEWFGMSTVKDEDDIPKVLYHGTPTGQDFTVFDTNRGEMGTHLGTQAHANTFAGDGARRTSSAARVYPVFAKIENPIRLIDRGSFEPYNVSEQLIDQDYFTRKEIEALEIDAIEEGKSFDPQWELQRAIEDKGYDGIVYLNRREGIGVEDLFHDKGDGHLMATYDEVDEMSDKEFKKLAPGSEDSYIVFRPEQIKSATGNSGDFDEKSPDIRFAVREKEKDPFYSQLSRAAETTELPSKAQSLAPYLLKKGVKPAEMEWMGVDQWIKDNQKDGKIDRDAFREFLVQNQIQMEETTKGKPSENEIDTFLADEAGKGMTREEAKSYLENDEAFPKFSQYTLPGGENYHEMLLTVPVKLPNETRFDVIKSEKGWKLTEDGRTLQSREFPTREAAQDTARRYNESNQRAMADKASYRSPHWDETNVLGHIRMNDREADGKSVLFLEEIQSDWHQAGKKEGYGDKVDKWEAGTKFTVSRDAGYWVVKDEHGREWFSTTADTAASAEAKAAELNRTGIYAGERTIHGIPPAPFAKNWHELLFKRMLRHAVENGYEKLAWTTGTQQAERYELSRHIDEISWMTRLGSSNKAIGLFLKNSQKLPQVVVDPKGSIVEGRWEGQKLEDVIGKELARKIIADEKGSLKGVDLKIGGEGMASFYDKLIPGFAEKYVKQWGSKVGTTGIPTEPDYAKWTTEYKGSEFSLEEVDSKVKEWRKLWYGKDATAEGWNAWNTSLDAQAEDVIRWMGKHPRWSFKVAMEEHGSVGLAEKFGGELITHETPDKTVQVHSVDITPAMKESVMQGQPLFATRKKTGETGRYLGANILSGEEKTPAIKRVRGFVPIYTAAKYLSDQSAAHNVIDHVTATPKQNKTVEAAFEDMLKKSLAKHPEALRWYHEDLDDTRKILSALDPDIQKPANRFRLNLALALTSDGNRPIDNTFLGYDVYKNWKDKGAFATGQSARRETSIQDSLALVRRLETHFKSDEEFEKWLLEKKPKGEIARELSELLSVPYAESVKLFSGELDDTVIPRASMFGPKIGAFFGSLSGEYDNLTMDMWFMRTAGRIQGNLAIVPTHEQIAARREALRTALDSSPEARKFLGIEPDLFGPIWTDDYLDKIARDIKKLSTKKTIRDSLADIEGGDELRLAGNSRASQITGELVETPTSGEHRNWLRDRIKAVQKSMAAQGTNIETADIQAAIWIGEKEIYHELGTRPVKGHYFSDGARALHERLLGRTFGGDAGATGRVEEGGKLSDQTNTLFRLGRKSREELDKTYAIPKTLATVLANPNGFTIDLRTGEAQKEQYFVSPSKRTETVLDHPPTEQDITDFINKYLPVFESDPKAMLGGWLRQEDGKHVLDVSYAQTDHNTAMYMGAHGKQDKIYHGASETEFDVAEGIQAMKDSGAYSEEESAKYMATRDALEKILDEDEATHFSIRKKEKDAVRLRMPGLETMTEMKQGIQSLLLPTAKSPGHLAAAIVVGKQLGQFNRESAVAATALRADEMMFTRMGVFNPDLPMDKNPGMKFASDVSTGRPMDTALRAISDRIATISARLLKGLDDAGVKLQTVRENYFPGMWEQKSIKAFNMALREAFDQGIGKENSDVNEWSKSQKAWVKNRVDELLKDNKGSDQSALSYLTRTPIKGKESFRKKKTFDDIMTAVEFGLRPVSPNPIELVKLKFAEMGKSLMANRAINEFEAKGDIINVGNNGKPLKKNLQPGFNQADWVKINDKYGTIWHVNEETHMMEKIGERWAKRPVADILNNYLSSSIYNNPYFGKAFKLHMGVANLLNQSQLSILSAFHAGFTTGEVTISQFGEAIKDMYGFAVSGNRSFNDVLKSVGKIPGAFIRTPMEGSRILREYDTPTMNVPSNVQLRQLLQNKATRVAIIARAAEIAGGGFRMEQGLKTEWYDKMLQEWHGGQKLKAAMRSPVAFTEMTAKPILEWLVPRQKAGVFGELAGRVIEMNSDKTLDELAPQLREVWNRIDARLGQVQYDRLFINNTAKNAIQALIRAPGWSGGTIAEIGGSFKDTAKFLKEWMKTGKAPADIPDRVAYTVALMTGVAAVNGLLTYLLTGEKPEGADYWAFRDGGLDEHGRPSRWVLPTYQKDIHAYMEDPGHVLMAKTHPLVSLISDVMKNKDYYGVRIRNVEDPKYQQAGDIAKYGVKQFVPFWMRGAAKEAERGGGFAETLAKTPAKLIAPQVGIMPAANAYTATAFEKYSQGLHEHLARTKEQFEHSKIKNQLVMDLRRGDPQATQKIYDAMTSRTITRKDAADIHKKARTNPLVASAAFMSLEELSVGLKKYASPEERQALLRPFLVKLRNKMTELSPEDRDRYITLLREIRDAV